MTTTAPPTADLGPVLYDGLLDSARRSRRCPVWLAPATLERIGRRAPRPIPVPTVVRTGARQILTDWWPGPCPLRCGCRDPFVGAFPPRLVRAGSDRSTFRGTRRAAVGFAAEVGSWSSLAVLDAVRPADVPAALGWAADAERDPLAVATVLRSWESRFGALLVHVGETALLLSVADPPVTDDECLHVAAEHLAFCPDRTDPWTGAEHTLRSYADSIRGARRWRFRWD
ncbi:DUF4253 domain-containing protein [Pseudonocardia nematodicida]|uniref:DUF4253 domain-containing protein n=1 Tax=Pseudonocardia nematodicida TaxID=1206997 RepID=A0ABV1KH53_9PSEU